MGRCRRNCKDSKPYLASACLLSHIVLFDFCWAKHHIAMSFVLVLFVCLFDCLFVCLFVCCCCCCCSRRCCSSYCCDVGGANFVCRVSFLDKPTQVRNLSWECCKSRFVSVSVLLHYWFACSWMRCSWSRKGRMKVVTRCLPMSSPRITSAKTRVLHEFFLRRQSVSTVVINEFSTSKARTFGKSKTRDGLIAMPNSCTQRWVCVPGRENCSCRSFTG